MERFGMSSSIGSALGKLAHYDILEGQPSVVLCIKMIRAALSKQCCRINESWQRGNSREKGTYSHCFDEFYDSHS